MSVALTVELTSWILSYGKDAEVLEPDDLRASIKEAVIEMSTVYEKDT